MITFPVANLKYIFPHPDHKITDAKLKYIFFHSEYCTVALPHHFLQIETKKRVRIRFRWLHKHRVACSVILSDSRENYLKRRNLFKMSSWIKLEGGNFPTFFVWVGLTILWFWEGFVWCTNGVQLPSGQSGLWCLVVDGDWSHLQKQREKKTVEESEYWEPSFNSLRWGVHRGFSGSTLRALLYYSEPQNTFAMVCYWCHKGNRTEGTRETDGITWDSI